MDTQQGAREQVRESNGGDAEQRRKAEEAKSRESRARMCSTMRACVPLHQPEIVLEVSDLVLFARVAVEGVDAVLADDERLPTPLRVPSSREGGHEGGGGWKRAEVGGGGWRWVEVGGGGLTV